MGAIQLKDTQQEVLNVSKKDKKGFATTDDFDAPPTWGSSDESIVKVVVDENGVASAVAGAPGVATVSFSAANNGVPFAGSVDVTILPGDVAAVDITGGDVSEQP